ncbi:MAG: hypothetical protein EHM35_13355, partial [Planctomycetaceae bacterium]
MASAIAKRRLLSGSLTVAFLVCRAAALAGAASSELSQAKPEEWAIPTDARKVFEGEYVHRIGERDSPRVKMAKYVGPDKTAYFELTGLSDRDYLLCVDGQGRPVSYKYRSIAKGYTDSYQFVGEKTVHTTWGSREQFDWEVKGGALPDFNSRPD